MGDKANGVVTVGTTLPLGLLGPDRVAELLTHVALVAGAADRMEERYGGGGDLY